MTKRTVDNPTIIQISESEMAALLARLEGCSLSDTDKALLSDVLRSHSWLYRTLESTKLTIRKFKAMLFGRTEKDKSTSKKNNDSTSGADRGASSDSEPESANDPNPDLPGGDSDADSSTPKGHGRYGVSDYGNREQVPINHSTFKPGDPCPENLCNGRLYLFRPGSFIRVMGQSMAKVTEYVVQKLRCSTCMTIVTAPMPDHVPREKYDEHFKSLLVLNRFFLSVPYYRQADFQEMFGFPLPESTQWELIESVAGVAIPVFKQLEYLTAQAELMYGDDTQFKILSLIEANKKGFAERTGMFTTCLLAVTDVQIVLFYAGRKHMGENLSDLLRLRQPGLKPLIQMCDALSSNITDSDQVIICHCLAHARRKFYEIKDSFPSECKVLLDGFAAIYHQDKLTKEKRLLPQARLEHHQKYNQPILDQMHTYMNNLIAKRQVEPNSALGKAIAYNLKHWTQLTRFTQLSGSPLDNNFCEQALKLPIRNRKNSLFYRNEYSAKMSSILMSVIYTCKLNNINPLDYLNTLQYHKAEVSMNPAAWLPWNYHDVALKKAA